MPIINLIQEQRVAEQKRDQRTRIAGYTLLIAVGFGTMGYAILLFQKTAYLAEISRLNQDIAANKPVVDQLDQCRKMANDLQPKLKTLGEAQKVSDKWSVILADLETQTPTGTWLTSMQCPPAPDDKPIALTITGTARAQEPIGEFTLRTQNNPFLENVALHFTQEKRSTTGLKQIDFEVGASILDSAEQKKIVKEEQKS